MIAQYLTASTRPKALSAAVVRNILAKYMMSIPSPLKSPPM